ncbi:hypothetical protein PMIN06_007748 [Paraphaeosphaeria minitans]|uniref:Uncharacterized protein n=1 Tax=Paraphaeosphaeria minitans TaxID=565426 RepID=A0A9P6GNM1_9PLEO|nr:hypothetical protein PMIN01_01621 [Paraphaeosphaeria minitans]
MAGMSDSLRKEIQEKMWSLQSHIESYTESMRVQQDINRHHVAVELKIVAARDEQNKLLGADNGILIAFLEAELDTIFEHFKAQVKESEGHRQQAMATGGWLLERGVDVMKGKYPEGLKWNVSRATQTDGA